VGRHGLRPDKAESGWDVSLVSICLRQGRPDRPGAAHDGRHRGRDG